MYVYIQTQYYTHTVISIYKNVHFQSFTFHKCCYTHSIAGIPSNNYHNNESPALALANKHDATIEHDTCTARLTVKAGASILCHFTFLCTRQHN